MSDYNIEAFWDAEVNVWVASSDEIPGLATEAATIEHLTQKLKLMIPDLLEANSVRPINSPISFALTTRREELIPLAS